MYLNMYLFNKFWKLYTESSCRLLRNRNLTRNLLLKRYTWQKIAISPKFEDSESTREKIIIFFLQLYYINYRKEAQEKW